MHAKLFLKFIHDFYMYAYHFFKNHKAGKFANIMLIKLFFRNYAYLLMYTTLTINYA